MHAIPVQASSCDRSDVIAFMFASSSQATSVRSVKRLEINVERVEWANVWRSVWSPDSPLVHGNSRCNLSSLPTLRWIMTRHSFSFHWRWDAILNHWPAVKIKTFNWIPKQLSFIQRFSDRKSWMFMARTSWQCVPCTSAAFSDQWPALSSWGMPTLRLPQGRIAGIRARGEGLVRRCYWSGSRKAIVCKLSSSRIQWHRLK